MKKEKTGIERYGVILFSVLLVAIIIALSYLNNEKKSDDNIDNTDKQEVIATPDKLNKINSSDTVLYQGEDNAANEILFVFDYACPWCKKWESENFPNIQKLIDDGVVKYRTQSMVYLNDISLRLANFDQNLKRNYPNMYSEINQKIMLDGHNKVSEWGTDDYIEGIIYDYKLDKEKLLSSPVQDSISVTRNYTKELKIDSVPAVFVNGIKVNDPFDYNEIESLLQKNTEK